jgi:Rrf2 family iron-sulfur cluster assembly transcriptional regulator
MRLEITRRADLATRAMLELARLDRRAKAAELAARVGTTPGFLAQAMTPLVSRGWVRSEPGPTGGYAAAVGLDSVSVLDVIESVEGPTDSGRCVLEDRPCAGASQCALHQPWSRARSQLLSELGRTPLSALAPAEDEP